MHGWATSRGVEILRKIQTFEKVLRFRQVRFPTTPFGHAFRPRLPATSSDVPFGSRDVMLLAELAVPLIFGAMQR